GHADAIGSRRRKGDPGNAAQEEVRELDQDPGPITGVWICALGAAMAQIDQRRGRRVDHLVRGALADARHEGDATPVVVEARVVQTLLRMRGAHLFAYERVA